jgi:hypothetical protein
MTDKNNNEILKELGYETIPAEPTIKPDLWFVEDYLRKALNRWDTDGKYWVEQALNKLIAKQDEPAEPKETTGEFIKKTKDYLNVIHKEAKEKGIPIKKNLETTTLGAYRWVY